VQPVGQHEPVAPAVVGGQVLQLLEEVEHRDAELAAGVDDGGGVLRGALEAAVGDALRMRVERRMEGRG